MRASTGAVLLVIVVGLAAVGVVALVADGGTLDERWVSDTGRDIKGNHHASAVARVGERSLVFTPISDRGNGTGCGLFALDAADGSVAWKDRVSAANCTLHAVADPTVADVNGDGTPEVLATSTEEVVTAYDAATGTETMRHELSAYGYTRPLVANLTSDPGREVAVVDVRGTLWVVRPDGSTVWSRELGGSAQAQPAVADFDGDGGRELAVAFSPGPEGRVALLRGDGSTAWEASVDDSIIWTAAGQADDDRPVEFVVATADGDVVAFDGRNGAVEWRRSVGDLAAVHDVSDADGDGTAEVYAVSKEGALFALDGRDGSVEWRTELTAEDTNMTPPPVVGDVDGDGTPELVAVTNDGKVAVVSPDSGDVLATYERSVPIYTHAALGDLDGDGRDEVYVIYGDGRVVSLTYEE